MTTATLDHDQRVAAVPDLYRRLMAQPLRPLTRARLPAGGAVYVFYQEDEPIHVGSPPHLEERMLAPSLRVALAARVQNPGDGGASSVSVSEALPRPGRRKPIEARWLPLAHDQDRLLLELYAAQTLGLSVSHPKVRAELIGA